MQETVLNYLRCPLSGEKLEIKVIDRKLKKYTVKTINEINPK
jgi:hypothetical protein